MSATSSGACSGNEAGGTSSSSGSPAGARSIPFQITLQTDAQSPHAPIVLSPHIPGHNAVNASSPDSPSLLAPSFPQMDRSPSRTTILTINSRSVEAVAPHMAAAHEVISNIRTNSITPTSKRKAMTRRRENLSPSSSRNSLTLPTEGAASSSRRKSTNASEETSSLPSFASLFPPGAEARRKSARLAIQLSGQTLAAAQSRVGKSEESASTKSHLTAISGLAENIIESARANAASGPTRYHSPRVAAAVRDFSPVTSSSLATSSTSSPVLLSPHRGIVLGAGGGGGTQTSGENASAENTSSPKTTGTSSPKTSLMFPPQIASITQASNLSSSGNSSTTALSLQARAQSLSPNMEHLRRVPPTLAAHRATVPNLIVPDNSFNSDGAQLVIPLSSARSDGTSNNSTFQSMVVGLLRAKSFQQDGGVISPGGVPPPSAGTLSSHQRKASLFSNFLTPLQMHRSIGSLTPEPPPMHQQQHQMVHSIRINGRAESNSSDEGSGSESGNESSDEKSSARHRRRHHRRMLSKNSDIVQSSDDGQSMVEEGSEFSSELDEDVEPRAQQSLAGSDDSLAMLSALRQEQKRQQKLIEDEMQASVRGLGLKSEFESTAIGLEALDQLPVLSSDRSTILHWPASIPPFTTHAGVSPTPYCLSILRSKPAKRTPLDAALISTWLSQRSLTGNLFAGLSNRDLALIALRVTIEKMPVSTFITKEQQESDRVYLMLTGLCSVWQRSGTAASQGTTSQPGLRRRGSTSNAGGNLNINNNGEIFSPQATGPFSLSDYATATSSTNAQLPTDVPLDVVRDTLLLLRNHDEHAGLTGNKGTKFLHLVSVGGAGSIAAGEEPPNSATMAGKEKQQKLLLHLQGAANHVAMESYYSSNESSTNPQSGANGISTLRHNPDYMSFVCGDGSAWIHQFLDATPHHSNKPSTASDRPSATSSLAIENKTEASATKEGFDDLFASNANASSTAQRSLVAVLGLEGVLFDSRRNASVVTEEMCEFLVIPAWVIQRTSMKKRLVEQIERKVACLRAMIPLLQKPLIPVADRFLTKLLYYFHLVKVSAGNTIEKEGDPLRWVYFILQGEVEIRASRSASAAIQHLDGSSRKQALAAFGLALTSTNAVVPLKKRGSATLTTGRADSTSVLTATAAAHHTARVESEPAYSLYSLAAGDFFLEEATFLPPQAFAITPSAVHSGPTNPYSAVARTASVVLLRIKPSHLRQFLNDSLLNELRSISRMKREMRVMRLKRANKTRYGQEKRLADAVKRVRGRGDIGTDTNRNGPLTAATEDSSSTTSASSTRLLGDATATVLLLSQHANNGTMERFISGERDAPLAPHSHPLQHLHPLLPNRSRKRLRIRAEKILAKSIPAEFQLVGHRPDVEVFEKGNPNALPLLKSVQALSAAVSAKSIVAPPTGSTTSGSKTARSMPNRHGATVSLPILPHTARVASNVSTTSTNSEKRNRLASHADAFNEIIPSLLLPIASVRVKPGESSASSSSKSSGSEFQKPQQNAALTRVASEMLRTGSSGEVARKITDGSSPANATTISHALLQPTPLLSSVPPANPQMALPFQLTGARDLPSSHWLASSAAKLHSGMAVTAAEEAEEDPLAAVSNAASNSKNRRSSLVSDSSSNSGGGGGGGGVGSVTQDLAAGLGQIRASRASTRLTPRLTIAARKQHVVQRDKLARKLKKQHAASRSRPTSRAGTRPSSSSNNNTVPEGAIEDEQPASSDNHEPQSAQLLHVAPPIPLTPHAVFQNPFLLTSQLMADKEADRNSPLNRLTESSAPNDSGTASTPRSLLLFPSHHDFDSIAQTNALTRSLVKVVTQNAVDKMKENLEQEEKKQTRAVLQSQADAELPSESKRADNSGSSATTTNITNSPTLSPNVLLIPAPILSLLSAPNALSASDLDAMRELQDESSFIERPHVMRNNNDQPVFYSQHSTPRRRLVSTGSSNNSSQVTSPMSSSHTALVSPQSNLQSPSSRARVSPAAVVEGPGKSSPRVFSFSSRATHSESTISSRQPVTIRSNNSEAVASPAAAAAAAGNESRMSELHIMKELHLDSASSEADHLEKPSSNTLAPSSSTASLATLSASPSLSQLVDSLHHMVVSKNLDRAAAAATQQESKQQLDNNSASQTSLAGQTSTASLSLPFEPLSPEWKHELNSSARLHELGRRLDKIKADSQARLLNGQAPVSASSQNILAILSQQPPLASSAELSTPSTTTDASASIPPLKSLFVSQTDPHTNHAFHWSTMDFPVEKNSSSKVNHQASSHTPRSVHALHAQHAASPVVVKARIDVTAPKPRYSDAPAHSILQRYPQPVPPRPTPPKELNNTNVVVGGKAPTGANSARSVNGAHTTTSNGNGKKNTQVSEAEHARRFFRLGFPQQKGQIYY